MLLSITTEQNLDSEFAGDVPTEGEDREARREILKLNLEEMFKYIGRLIPDEVASNLFNSPLKYEMLCRTRTTCGSPCGRRGRRSHRPRGWPRRGIQRLRPRSSRRFMASSPVRDTGSVAIGLICAIPQELDAPRTVLVHTHTERAAHARIRHRHDRRSRCRAGRLRNGKGQRFARHHLAGRPIRCRAVIFSTVAGGLDPALAIGDIVVADQVIRHDAGVFEDERVRVYQPGHAPIINPPIGWATSLT